MPIDDYGIDLEVIVLEPLLKTPKSMDFDSKEMVWVVQMPRFYEQS